MGDKVGEQFSILANSHVELVALYSERVEAGNVLSLVSPVHRKTMVGLAGATKLRIN